MFRTCFYLVFAEFLIIAIIFSGGCSEETSTNQHSQPSQQFDSGESNIDSGDLDASAMQNNSFGADTSIPMITDSGAPDGKTALTALTDTGIDSQIDQDSNFVDNQNLQDSAAVDASPDVMADTEQSIGNVNIRWWGQSCFTVSVDGGATILTDPFNDIGYAMPTVEPQVVSISHEHPDHNSVANVPGTFETLRGVGEHQAAGIIFKGVATFHDNSGGTLRGNNTVFVWNMEGISFAHLGDLGHLLNEEQVQQIGPVDVLMIPVGGGFTIDGATAVQVAEQLSAKLIIPMHYGTEALTFNLAEVDTFLQEIPTEWTVDQPGFNTITVTSNDFTTDDIKVTVLSYQ